MAPHRRADLFRSTVAADGNQYFTKLQRCFRELRVLSELLVRCGDPEEAAKHRAAETRGRPDGEQAADAKHGEPRDGERGESHPGEDAE